MNGTRMVLISGPSSSGKTTSPTGLAIQLGVLGLHPVLISLDATSSTARRPPKDENGDYDYEALEAIDLVLFNDHLQRLMRGESVDIPRYDFITGHRTWHNAPLQLDERSILIVGGNPRPQPAADTRDTGRPEIQDLCVVLHVGGDGQSVADFDDGHRLLRQVEVEGVKQTIRSDAMAVTDISQAMVNRLGISAIKDVGEIAPNFYMPDYGSRMTSSVYVRGLGSRMDQLWLACRSWCTLFK